MPKKKNIFVLSTSGFIIKHFFYDHLVKLSIDYNVTVLVPFSSFPEKNFNTNLFKLINFPIERKISIINDIKSLFNLIYILFKNRPNMIISLGPKSGLIGGLSSCLVKTKIRVFIFQGQVWSNKVGLYRFLLLNVDKLICFLNNYLISVSHKEKFFLLKNNIGAFNKIKVIGRGSICGVDLDKFNTINTRNISHKKNYFCFLFLGRFNKDKGVHDLVNAFISLNMRIKNIRLSFVGIDECDLVKQAKNKNIKFFKYSSNVPKILKEHDCLILPSYREGLPISILEAFGSKVPVIGSNIYGINSLIKHNETGLLFPAGNVELLKKQMKRIICNQVLVNKIVENAYNHAKRYYNKTTVINNYQNYFNRIIK